MGCLNAEGVRDFISRGVDAASLLFSLTRSGKITFSEFLEELDLLGLKGKTFGPDCYRRALETYLGLTIEIVLVDDRNDRDARRAFIRDGHTGVLWYRPGRNLAQIFVLASLPPLELAATIYHELSHLAAGHRLRTGDPHIGRKLEARAHARRLARRPPPIRAAALETEARIREEYCMLAGTLGPACLEDDALRQPR